jgi:hypothetical protein
MRVSAPPSQAALRERHAHIWKRDPSDFYVEDQWVSAELFKYEKFPLRKIHDPFCGTGRVLNAAIGYAHEASGSDIVARLGVAKHDFRILDATGPAATQMFRWDRHIVSNPPYQLVDYLLTRMIDDGLGSKCALFMRLTAVAGKSRYLRHAPLSHVLICKPRPNCLPGEAIIDGAKAGGGQVDYAWFVFDPKRRGDPTFRYLHKSQPTDYRQTPCLAATT